MRLRVRDIDLHYVEAGEGRPIVILHGLPADHRMPLDHLEPVFAARPGWRRIYLDLPGMGATPIGSVASVDDMLEVVLRAIDELTGSTRFATVGVSFGGHLARGVLARRADRLDGIMLWAPSVWTDGRPVRLPPFEALVSDPHTVASVEPDEQAWLGIAVVQTPETLEAFRTSVKPGVLTADLDSLRGLRRPLSLSESNLDPSGPFVGPSLIVTGRQDSECGYLDAWDLVDDLPRATFAVLDRAGHGVAAERQRLFRMLVDDWLDRMELEAPAAPDG
jgi:pimeloyl-ACP methyl ester carboxylesterase